MLYAIFAYHVQGAVTAMTAEEDAALMSDLEKVRESLVEAGQLGPAARLDITSTALTLRDGMVIDGPFAETKEQLLGLYLVDCESRAEAVEIARSLQKVNVTAVYEIRPVKLYIPGLPFPKTAAPTQS